MNNWVTIKRDRVDEALAWAKANCPHYITNDYHMCGYNLYDISSTYEIVDPEQFLLCKLKYGI